MGIDSSLQQAGGLSPQGMQIPRSPRQIVMLQRKASKPGQGLGKTTGWIHRTTLLAGCENDPGVSYQKIDDDGLHVVINGEPQVLAVDNVVICAGQEPNRALAQPLIDGGKTVHLIGGCDVAMELDARRAIARNTAGAGDLNRYLKRRMRRIRHVALINKQGGRNAESRCQFFSVFQR